VAAALSACGAPPPPSEAAVARVMQAVRVRPRPAVGRPAVGHPAASPRVPARAGWWRGAAAAGLLLAGAAGARAWRGRAEGAPAAPAAVPVAEASARPVRFHLTAPAASGVAVVGDFNGWNAAATPMRRDRASGEWTAEVPLADGRYVYAFVVDDRRWLPDPNAALAPADGFGRQNSVLVVSTLLASALDP
jgi:hypothetical protein